MTYTQALQNAELEGHTSVTPIWTSHVRKKGVTSRRREISLEIRNQVDDVCEGVEGYKRRGRMIVWIYRGTYGMRTKAGVHATVVAIVHR